MDGNEAAAIITAQIKALRADLLGVDPAKKAAATKAIAELQAARARIIVLEADKIGPEIDKLVKELEDIQNEHGLDAVSALGRTIKRLADRRQPAAAAPEGRSAGSAAAHASVGPAMGRRGFVQPLFQASIAPGDRGLRSPSGSMTAPAPDIMMSPPRRWIVFCARLSENAPFLRHKRFRACGLKSAGI